MMRRAARLHGAIRLSHADDIVWRVSALFAKQLEVLQPAALLGTVFVFLLSKSACWRKAKQQYY